MKQLLFILAAVIFLFTADGRAQTVVTGSLPFERFDGSYFEKNNSGLQGEPSFVVITDQKQFNQVFGPAARMRNNKFLSKDAFDSEMVVATIKRGSLRKYTVEKIIAEDGKLFVWYTTEDKPPGSATFKSALILAVEKGDYEEVVFMANGEKAGSVSLEN